MRRLLRFFKWTGLGLSSLLFVTTLLVWGRSWGHDERWGFLFFEYRPEWNPPRVTNCGRYWEYEAGGISGRLWLAYGRGVCYTEMPYARPYHARKTISPERAESDFRRRFDPYGGPDRWSGQIAGVGYLAQFGTWTQKNIPYRGEPSVMKWLCMPLWMPAVLFGLWPTLFTTRRILRRKRFANGLCPKCGYDLRATPDRCPECGTAPCAPPPTEKSAPSTPPIPL